MQSSRSNSNVTKKGFTLIELMMVVAIITILAAVAIPMVSKYLRKSKTTEAALNLRKIYDGEVAYYSEEHTDSTGALLSKMFLSFSPEPATPSDNKQTVNWDTNGWGTIKFSSDSPVMYSYSVETAGVDITASFTARAVGDIDGDGVTSLFERLGTVNATIGSVEGGSAIFSLDDLE